MKNRKNDMTNRPANRLNNRKGFTLAELLIVIAIIMILAGFGTVAVIQHQEKLQQRERDDIAREIYYAAQNFLTAAWADGSLQTALDTHKDAEEKVQYFGEKYNSYNLKGNTSDYSFLIGSEAEHLTTALNLLLPMDAPTDFAFSTGIDLENGEGHYAICYVCDLNNNAVAVLDVFYSEKVSALNYVKSTYSADKTITEADVEKKAKNSKVGYYGASSGQVAKESALLRPNIIIHNEEALYAEIIEPNKLKDGIKLTIKGMESGAEIPIEIEYDWTDTSVPFKSYYRVMSPNGAGSNVYCLMLDSLVLGGNYHFCNIFSNPVNGKKLVPGEDIQISVILSSDDKNQQMETSSPVFNSLFAGIDGVKTTDVFSKEITEYRTAYISNFRHLENLHPDISGVTMSFKSDDTSNTLALSTVRQVDDLLWTTNESDKQGFVQKVITEGPLNTVLVAFGLGDSAVNVCNKNGVNAENNAFYPVNCSNTYKSCLSEYDGGLHTIKGIRVKTRNSEGAGLFSIFEEGIIKDLKLIDFQITSEAGNAGALAGTLKNGGVLNVVLFNETEKENEKKNLTDSIPDTIPLDNKPGKDFYVQAAKNAGGLIGEVILDRALIETEINRGMGKIVESAAATSVEASTNGTSGDTGHAGGLIGQVSGTGVVLKYCYSGGHTWKGKYTYSEGGSIKELLNVTAKKGAAGGLIGDAGSAGIQFSYSTCSASGTTFTGGFVGSSTGALDHCYSVGMVQAADTDGKVGAFAGTMAVTGSGNCFYESIINPIVKADGSLDRYMLAVDDSAAAESTVVRSIDDSLELYMTIVPDQKAEAYSYDPLLEVYFNQDGKKIFNYCTVYQLDSSISTVPADKFVAKHFGDWPAPETLVINTK